MIKVVYKVKKKSDHSEHICTSFSGLFQYFSEEDLGMKICGLYLHRKKNFKPFDVIETPKVYIEVLPLYKSRNVACVPSFTPSQPERKASVDDIVTMLSIKCDNVRDDEDNVIYVLDLFKRRMVVRGVKNNLIHEANGGYINFGPVEWYGDCFSFEDIEKMRERGLCLNRANDLCLKIESDLEK